MIVQRDWKDDLVILKTIEGKVVNIGDVLVSTRGPKYKLTDAYAPHTPPSNGKVHVQEIDQEEDEEMSKMFNTEREVCTHIYYPSVFDLEWLLFKPAAVYEQNVHEFIKSTLKTKGK